MKRLFSRWILVSGILSVGFLLFALLFERAFVDLIELVMQPWFAFSQFVTPEEWQTLGNIPLGLSWMISGVLFYASLLGATAVALVLVWNKIRTSK